jgi:hypothetical protein
MWLRYNFSKEKSLSHRFTVTSLPVHQSTVISQQLPVHHSPLTTNSSLRPSRVLDTMALVYRHKPITRTDRNYSPFTNHQNPLNHYTTMLIHYSRLTTHHSPLSTHDSPLTTTPLVCKSQKPDGVHRASLMS